MIIATTTTENKLLAEALRLADLGYPVLPCKPDKAPYLEYGLTDASTDPEQIEKWWATWPAANIGIRTDGLLIVDRDDNPSGWPHLEERFDDLAAAPTVLTPRGGLSAHTWYRQPAGKGWRNTAGKLAVGVDTRADGGYVIVPPSVTEKGAYRRVDPLEVGPEHLPEPPAWLIAEMDAVANKSKAPKPSHQSSNGEIPEGKRNASLTSLAGAMRRVGGTPENIAAALHNANQTRCNPPLPDTEVDRIAASVGNYPPAEDSKPATELQYAARLIDEHGDLLRFCIQFGWLHYTGSHWERDQLDVVLKLCKAMVIGNKRFQSNSRVRGIVALAESDERIRVRSEVFDADPWALNVSNGTIDLRTGKLRPHNPADHLTKLANVTYDPDADCPRFERFIGEVFDGDSELVAFVQRAIGYSLTGDCREQCLFLLYGTGSNGKSVLLLTLQHLFGSYALQTAAETFMVKRTDAIRNDVARLAGARLVSAIETEEGQRLAESLVKQLTGGDKVTARFLFREHFEFTPAFKLFLAANHKPTIKGQDFAIWRRIHLIPFAVTFEGEHADKGLAATLQAEAPGILNWALAGLRTWLELGLQPPGPVKAATAAYRAESDALGEFIEARCVLGPDAETRATEFYAAYATWAESVGDKPMSRNAFGRRLTDRGIGERRTGRTRWRVGIALEGESQASMVTQ